MSSQQQRPPAQGRRFYGSALTGDLPHFAIAVFLDVLVVGVAYLAALLLRFDGSIPHVNADFTFRALPLIALAYVLANMVFGTYRTMWAYGSLGDIVALFRPVLLVTAVLFTANLLLHDRDLPLSVIIIAGGLVFPGMAVVKMRARLLKRMPWHATASDRLLIVGAGHTGQLLARELQNSQSLNYQPVAFVDDDPKKLKTRIHGLRVRGTTAQVGDLIRAMDIDVVAIAMPTASGAFIRRIVAACQEQDVPIRIVPGVDNWVTGAHGTLRDITVEDLLGREAVQVDYGACSDSVRDKVVLVTGAAGSIGSELVRQVLSFSPRELHLLDNNESGLYDLSAELSGLSPETSLRLWVANVVEERKIDSIFNKVRPDLVYHAAALKHVPMMEDHPDEAFRVNVLGTLNVAVAARSYQTGMFVLISTDKAVRPSSIMGATKRIAELLVISLARGSELTNYAAVRFGNVMGSRGSVVPLFMSQIERGGPVALTHPDMMRYFISIPEAVSLVIQAGTFGGHGNVFMLDMGEEISIRELAERMIRLRGLRPGQDIEVVFTGPRPGEKLREELVADFESTEATEHPKVMRLSSTVEVTEPEIMRLIAEIAEEMWSGDLDELRRRIHLVARRYSLDESESGTAPRALPPAGKSLA